MRKIFELFRTDFKRRWKKPLLLLIYIASPVILTFIMWLVFGQGGRGISPLSLGLVNNDRDGVVAKFLIGALQSDQIKERVNVSLTDSNSARDLIDKGEISAILIIPKNFSRNFLDELSPSLHLVKNPAHQIFPEMSETLVEILKDGINYLLSIFYDEFKSIKTIIANDGKADKEALFKIFNQSRGKVKIIASVIDDIPLELKQVTKEKEKGDSGFSILVYVFPGISLFFMFFVADAVLIDSVKERGKFIIKRLFASNLKKWQYIWAKFLSAILFLFLMGCVLSACGYIFFNIKVNSMIIFLCILIVTSVLITALFACFTALSNDEKQVNNISMIFIFMFDILGGGMVPLNNLPAFMQRIGFISPLYHLNKAFMSLLVDDMGAFFFYFWISLILAIVLLGVAFYMNHQALKKVFK